MRVLLVLVAMILSTVSAYGQETCLFVTEGATSGLNKTCHYTCPSGDYTTTINAISLCSLSIKRQDGPFGRTRGTTDNNSSPYQFTSPGAAAIQGFIDGMQRAEERRRLNAESEALRRRLDAATARDEAEAALLREHATSDVDQRAEQATARQGKPANWNMMNASEQAYWLEHGSMLPPPSRAKAANDDDVINLLMQVVIDMNRRLTALEEAVKKQP